jgi:hypothetical protein
MAEPRHGDRRMHSAELVFQMSSELHRRQAIDAIDVLDGESVRAFPVERVSTAEPLLLVLVVDIEHVSQAVAVVLSVDPQARRAQPS